jgi:hypothetical protein
MMTGIGFVALLTGALAQRFLYSGNEDAASGAPRSEDETMRKLEDMSDQIAQLQRALDERRR